MTDEEKKTMLEAATLDALGEAASFAKLESKIYEAADMARKLGRQDITDLLYSLPRGRWVTTDEVVRVVMGFNPGDYDYFNGSNHYGRALRRSGAPCEYCEHDGTKHEALYEECKADSCDCEEYVPNERPMDTLKRLTEYEEPKE